MWRDTLTGTQLSRTSDFCPEVLKSWIPVVAGLVVEGVGQADHLHSVWGSSCLQSDVLTVSNIKPFFYVFVLMAH